MRKAAAVKIIEDVDLSQLSGIPDLGDGAAIRWHPDGQHFLVTGRSPGWCWYAR